jgi:NAD(P)-dependent dehydrogenase (short-subunit alcohol dehydrogenase family)
MSDLSPDYTGKVVLVTGGATGIGRATALVFATHGAAVVIADIDARGGDTVALIEQAGGRAAFIETDVTVAAQVERAVTECVDRFGGLHAAFNNAGVLPPTAPLVQMPEADWDRIIKSISRACFSA